jgi:hypothetical protein
LLIHQRRHRTTAAESTLCPIAEHVTETITSGGIMLKVVPRACIRLLGFLFRRADVRLTRDALRNAGLDVGSWDTRRLDVGMTLRDLRRLPTAGPVMVGDARGW